MTLRNFKMMNSRLLGALMDGNVGNFLEIVNTNNIEIIEGRTNGSQNTFLHLASKCNLIDMVREIIVLRPALVLAKNSNMETPLHEACRAGNVVIFKMLLAEGPSAAYMFNANGESILVVAIRHGHFEIVDYIMTNCAQLFALEDGSRTTSIHAATDKGHIAIVRELLQRELEIEWRRDSEGRTPLHIASSNGQLEITRVFLKLATGINLCFSQDVQGRTPLHWAAVNGHVCILKEILSMSLELVNKVSTQGETALHLAVKNKKINAVKYLMDNLDITNLVNSADINGNTIFHLAAAAKHTQILAYLVTKSQDVNSLNRNDLTPLDMVDHSVPNDQVADELTATLVNFGGKKGSELPNNPSLVGILYAAPRINRGKVADQIDHYNEGLLNTIIIVYVLVATVTFVPVFSPPGGFYQDGIHIGKPVLGRTTGYKVFTLFNNAALYSALGGVVILVSYLPFKRGPMMKMLLALAHKIMVVSLSFLIAAHLAATWVTMHSAIRGKQWDSVAAVSVGGGTLISLVVAGGVIYLWHLNGNAQGCH